MTLHSCPGYILHTHVLTHAQLVERFKHSLTHCLEDKMNREVTMHTCNHAHCDSSLSTGTFTRMQARMHERVQNPGCSHTLTLIHVRVHTPHVTLQGGTIGSIIREAFLFWDGDNSGALDVEEFKGAIIMLPIFLLRTYAHTDPSRHLRGDLSRRLAIEQ